MLPKLNSAPGSNADLPPCTSVVMPVFNEAARVGRAVENVLAQKPVKELIIVDDASSDGTWEILKNISEKSGQIRIFRHEKNRGKGAALRTGFQHVTAPIVLVQDADSEYDPSEYFLLLWPILADRADVVFGSRFLGVSRRVGSFWHTAGNRFLTLLSNMATNLNITDMESCFKAFRLEVLQRLRLKENRFGFEPEVTAKVSHLKVRIYEVPISYYGRTYAEGKKINWRDGFSALRCIIKYNLFFRRDK